MNLRLNFYLIIIHDQSWSEARQQASSSSVCSACRCLWNPKPGSQVGQFLQPCLRSVRSRSSPRNFMSRFTTPCHLFFGFLFPTTFIFIALTGTFSSLTLSTWTSHLSLRLLRNSLIFSSPVLSRISSLLTLSNYLYIIRSSLISSLSWPPYSSYLPPSSPCTQHRRSRHLWRSSYAQHPPLSAWTCAISVSFFQPALILSTPVRAQHIVEFQVAKHICLLWISSILNLFLVHERIP